MNQYTRMRFDRRAFMKKAAAGLCLFAAGSAKAAAGKAPNFVLVMADDQGWGEMGYYKHPHLKTPNLDAMAANGLRFDRFYAGAPNCSGRDRRQDQAGGDRRVNCLQFLVYSRPARPGSLDPNSQRAAIE